MVIMKSAVHEKGSREKINNIHADGTTNGRE
jgi:hypothetical protein